MMLLSLLFACGEKCPKGYEVNDEEKACYPVEETTDTDTTDTDTTDTNTTDTEDTTSDTGEEIIDPFADLERLNGKIIIPSLYEGRLIPRNAFWYEEDGHFVLYAAATSSATCEMVSAHLSSDDNSNPNDIFVMDHCNAGIYLDNINDLENVNFFSECSFGQGSFENSTGSWRWSGTDENGVEAEFFNGIDIDGELLDYLEDGNRRALQINVTEWMGSFPYSNTGVCTQEVINGENTVVIDQPSFNNDQAGCEGQGYRWSPEYTTSQAFGNGSGYIFATECPSLTSSSYLFDGDNDGWRVRDGDCNDNDPSINPEADEIWYDGIDQNCDEANDYDQDGDGFISDAHGGDDCNDTDSSINPGTSSCQ